MEQGESPDKYKVSGRGELHLSVLIESMRREGYELAVSRPEVIIHEHNGVRHEPYESLVVDCDEQHQGAVIEELGVRRAKMQDMLPDGKGRVRLEFLVPTRGLIGFRSQFLSMTSGTGLLTHVFDHYGPYKDAELAGRNNGVLVSMWVSVPPPPSGDGSYNLDAAQGRAVNQLRSSAVTPAGDNVRSAIQALSENP